MAEVGLTNLFPLPASIHTGSAHNSEAVRSGEQMSVAMSMPHKKLIDTHTYVHILYLSMYVDTYVCALDLCPMSLHTQLHTYVHMYVHCMYIPTYTKTERCMHICTNI